MDWLKSQHRGTVSLTKRRTSHELSEVKKLLNPKLEIPASVLATLARDRIWGCTILLFVSDLEDFLRRGTPKGSRDLEGGP